MSYKAKFSSSKGWNAIDTNIRLVKNGRWTSDGYKFMKMLKGQGANIIIRYYASSRRSKTVTKEEVRKFAEDGFYFLPVYQDNARKTSDFSYSKGVQAGKNALDFVDYIGQPDGTTILFAVDTDFSQSEIEKYVVPYFKGVKEVLDGRFRIGCYGSGLAMDCLKKEDLIELVWLSMSRGFRGTKKTFEGDEWHMRQIPPDLKYRGIFYDKNEILLSPREIGAFKFGDEAVDKPVVSKIADGVRDFTDYARKIFD